MRLRRRAADIGRLAERGSRAETSLDEGFTRIYEWFLQNVASKAA